MTEQELQELMLRVRQSRHPLYGSVVTLPQRLGWTRFLTPGEIAMAAAHNDTVRIFVGIFDGSFERTAEFLAGATLEQILEKWDSDAFPNPSVGLTSSLNKVPW